MLLSSRTIVYFPIPIYLSVMFTIPSPEGITVSVDKIKCCESFTKVAVARPLVIIMSHDPGTSEPPKF